MRGPKTAELRSPQDALRAYLDEMLHLATALRPADSEAAPRRATGESPAAAVAGPADDETGRALELVAPPLAPAPAPAIEAGREDHAAATAAVAVEPEPEPAMRAPTETAADRFRFPLQCLMFRVVGHLLAVPLVELAGVIPAPGRLTRLPRLPAEVLGLLKHRERTLRVVDSARLLGIAAPVEPKRGHLLLLAAGDWALTCDAPGEVVYLARDDVRWRAAGADRLRYGTIRESLATLLDPDAICRRLERRPGA